MAALSVFHDWNTAGLVSWLVGSTLARCNLLNRLPLSFSLLDSICAILHHILDFCSRIAIQVCEFCLVVFSAIETAATSHSSAGLVLL